MIYRFDMNILATSIMLFALSTPAYLNKISPVRRGTPSQYVNNKISFIFIMTFILARYRIILVLLSTQMVRNKRDLFSIDLNDEMNETSHFQSKEAF